MKTELKLAISLNSLLVAIFVSLPSAFCDDEKISAEPGKPVDDWKPKEPLQKRMKKHSVKIHSIVLHHTETPNQPEALIRARLRGIQNFHLEKGWGDIAYHILIGPSGVVYLGRDPDFQGDSGTKYDLNGRLLVCVVGNFSEKHPEPGAVQSLIKTVNGLLSKHNLSVDDVTTHRMVASTDCPGDAFQKWFVENGKRFFKPK